MFSVFDQFELIYFCKYSNVFIFSFLEIVIGFLLIHSMINVNKKIINNNIVSWFFNFFVDFLTRLAASSYKNTVAWNVQYNNKEISPFFLLFGAFWFVFIANMLGMVPYAYTITAQLIITVGLSFYYFFGLNITKIKQQKLSFFARFVPSNISFILVPYLVPIETLSYLFRSVSLGVRLFANITAGHILLKVLMGFFWSAITSACLFFKAASFLILPVNIGIIGMEFVMGMLQAVVFINLLNFYIQDASVRYYE